MAIVLDCNKSCNKKITGLKDYNNNLILSNLVIISINTILDINITYYSWMDSFGESFVDYYSDIDDTL